MKEKIQMRKIGISIIIFFLISILVTSPMKIKINALLNMPNHSIRAMSLLQLDTTII